MNKELVLAHLGMGTGRTQPFDQIYKGEYVRPEDIKSGDIKLDALVVWGGEDISPSLYGDRVADLCGARDSLSYRDRIEAAAMAEAIERNIPIIGVCRGAQLLCAVAGGRLIQHVNGHTRSHSITTYDGRKIISSSVHHQMMYPFDVDHKMIAWATDKLSDVHIIGTNEDDPLMEHHVEPEIVWFPKIKGLAIQGHPEFHNPTDEFVGYCMDLVRKFILGEDQVS